MSKESIHCPKCGFEQEPSEECSRCGIIFSKFRKSSNTAAKNSAAISSTKQKKSRGSWGLTIRILRIFFLVFLLFFVAMSTWLTKLRTTDWDMPLRVVIYPINGDNSSVSSDYIDSLREDAFEAIEDFMREEAQHYALKLQDTVTVTLGPEAEDIPPRPPQAGSILSVMWWSLKLRYWAYLVTYSGPAADIRIFVVYFDPKAYERLDDSLGLQKGLIGVVYGYASGEHAARDNIVIAHEMLHTLGATDKYDSVTMQPFYPDGYAEPDRQPLLPQEMAEIMGSRTPLSKTRLKMPESLNAIVIGEKTAEEINWLQ